MWANGIINSICKSWECAAQKITAKLPCSHHCLNFFTLSLITYFVSVKKPYNSVTHGKAVLNQDHRTLIFFKIFNAMKDKCRGLKKPLYIYVGFKFANDNVNRHAMLIKLLTQVFIGKIISPWRNLFSKSKSQVKWYSGVGHLFDNMYSVLQGGTVSLTLFNKYVDDMQITFDGASGVKKKWQNDTKNTYYNPTTLFCYQKQVLVCKSSLPNLKNTVACVIYC